MNRILVIAVAAATLTGCALVDRQPNYDNPFYAKYLNTGSELDGRINQTLNDLRQDPRSAALHNELGTLLLLKGFPRDAEAEFERALNADGRFFPAWYNLGLVRAARGDEIGARRAFRYTIRHKPGHADALFQLGLIEEQRHNSERAIGLYAKAFRINPALLSVKNNPRILDSKLTHRALLRLYPTEHARRSMDFEGTPSGWSERRDPVAPSPEQAPEKIVPPAPAPTDPSQQPVPPPA